MSKSDLDEHLQDIDKDYKTEIVSITVSGLSLRCLRIADLDEIGRASLLGKNLGGEHSPGGLLDSPACSARETDP